MSYTFSMQVTPLVRQERVSYATTMPRYLDIRILGFNIRLSQNHVASVSTWTPFEIRYAIPDKTRRLQTICRPLI